MKELHALSTLVKRLKTDKKQLEASAKKVGELLEELRSQLQNCLHDMEMCGKHDRGIIEAGLRAIDGKILKESPFWAQPIEKLENQIEDLKAELESLKEQKPQLKS